MAEVCKRERHYPRRPTRTWPTPSARSAMDAVQKADSGHPGMPMGMADVATVLFTRFLKFDAAHPDWPDRDRFVLSAGHGSMLLYALLYLTGYPGMDDRGAEALPPARLAHAGPSGIWPCAGDRDHHRPARAGARQRRRHGASPSGCSTRRYGDEIVDHSTYVIAGDGCLMEGISQEAISLAGHLKLGRLIVLFDDNQISIDGPTNLSVSDDQIERFRASGWHTANVDGHDPEAIALAIENARAATDRPSLIACRTVIGYGAPKKQGTAATHGSPLGEEEIAGRARDAWLAVTRRSRCRSRCWQAGARRARGNAAAYERWQSGGEAARCRKARRISPIRSTPRCAARNCRRGEGDQGGVSSARAPSSPRGSPRRRCWRSSCP